MKLNRISIRYAAACFFSAILLMGIAYVFLAAIGLVPTPYTCMTETKTRITNLSGGDFEITDTGCDTLAKEEFVSVYVLKAGVNRGSWFTKWFRRKTLLFRYDPAMLDSPLPSISASGPNRILISIPRVSSIIFQSRNWGNVSIDYEIEHVDYPGTGASQNAPMVHMVKAPIRSLDFVGVFTETVCRVYPQRGASGERHKPRIETRRNGERKAGLAWPV